ncbi:hypothetical protein [Micromonospora sonchi]|nr:hypothetical protein [Micromonospora sonchi]
MREPTNFLVAPGEPDASLTKGFANPIGILDALPISHSGTHDLDHLRAE